MVASHLHHIHTNIHTHANMDTTLIHKHTTYLRYASLNATMQDQKSNFNRIETSSSNVHDSRFIQVSTITVDKISELWMFIVSFMGFSFCQNLGFCPPDIYKVDQLIFLKI